MARHKKLDESLPKQPPALTSKAREDQMIALSVDLAEKQLREGTASSQIIAHYLKLGSVREQMERKKLEEETKLLTAKTKQVEAIPQQEQLFKDAIAAMVSYRSPSIIEEENEDL